MCQELVRSHGPSDSRPTEAEAVAHLLGDLSAADRHLDPVPTIPGWRGDDRLDPGVSLRLGLRDGSPPGVLSAVCDDLNGGDHAAHRHPEHVPVVNRTRRGTGPRCRSGRVDAAWGVRAQPCCGIVMA